MGLNKLFQIIAFRPMEAVESIITSAVFIAGLWLVSPLYEPSLTASGRVAQSDMLPYILGVLHIILGAVWFYGMCINHKVSFRRTAQLSIFCLYLFYAISQVILFGVNQIPYVSIFAISFIAGVTYIWLGIGDGVNGD